MSINKCWYKEMAVYQIWPRSFCDGNGDGIGDIKGIMSKLDYIKSLGVDAIWFSPLYKSPQEDMGYDIADYRDIAEEYGTLDEFKELLEAIHARGMKVIMDLVINHTSNQHKWFLESMKSKDNPYHDYYFWRDGKKGGKKPPNNWLSTFSGPAWKYNEDLNQYYLHLFAEGQPDLNMDNPKVREEIKDIMRFWLGMGCDGFRVDMAGSLVKNDEDGKGNISLWQNVRSFLDAEYPEAVLVSEWGEPDKSLLGGFHMDFLLHFGPSHYPELFRTDKPYFSAKAVGDISEFVNKYKESYAKTDGKGLICIPSGNHDMSRMALTLDETEMKLAFAFLLSMPGAPFIYYGDEIGMRYVKGLTSVEGGYGRTGSRSPMQWDSGVNAGFGNSAPDKLYIPLDPDPNRPTVEKSMSDENSLYHEVKKLISLRKAHPALESRGKIDFIYAEKNAYPLAYTREADGEKILAVINPSARPAEFECGLIAKEVLYSFGGKAEADGKKIRIPAQSAVFAKV